jgi:hypothetical protein
MQVCRADNIILVYHQQQQQGVSHPGLFNCDSLSILCLVHLRFFVGRSVFIRLLQNADVVMLVYHKKSCIIGIASSNTKSVEMTHRN